MNRTVRSLLTVLACVPLAARAASFDCSAAKRPVELVICGNPQLDAADQRVGQFYRDALARLSSESVGRMRADQVQWLAWVQQLCPPTAKNTRRTAACMLPLYRARSRVLRTAVERHDGVTFFTRSQYFAVPDNRPEWKTYGDFPGMGTLQAQWPQADSIDPAWQAWNHQVEQRALQVASDGEDEDDPAPQKPAQPLAWAESMAVRRNAEMTARLKRVEHGRVTTWLSAESMGIPAAHPGDDFGANIWLLQQQRLLQATDVFEPGGRWKAVLGTAAYRALKTSNAKDYLFDSVTGPEAKPLQQVVTDVRNWTLETDGLHISYPDYAVAPRMAKPDDTVVPWSTLKPVLAAGFDQP